jgi:hypothetical protein
MPVFDEFVADLELAHGANLGYADFGIIVGHFATQNFSVGGFRAVGCE